MTRKPLRHILICSFALALSGCAAGLSDRVSLLEQRVTELEMNTQARNAALDARFESLNATLNMRGESNPPVPSVSAKVDKAKLISKEAERSTSAVSPGSVSPRHVDPAHSLAKLNLAPPSPSPATSTLKYSSLAPQNGASGSDPVGVALAEAGQKAPQKKELSSVVAPVPASSSALAPFIGRVAAVSPPSVQATSKAAPAQGQSEAAYKQALTLLESGKPEAAKQAFEAFLDEYPDNKLAPNAYYWLGEAIYSLKHYQDAILTFKNVTNKFPKHPKAPAALLKAAFAYLRLGDKDNARFYLQALLEEYPNSEPSGLAKQQLAKL